MLQTSSSGRDLQQAAADLLLTEVQFPHRRILYPLGFALDLASNSEQVLEAAVR